jgi:tetratricopeptide (TPR) repeat protein
VVVGQSLVDWFWLIPGLMGLGLFCLALAAALLATPPRAPRVTRRWSGAPGIAAGLGLLAAGASILVVFLSDFEARQARANAQRSTESQLAAARTAERLNPWAVKPRYLQASALETMGRRSEARDELQDALELEPGNFATLGLLGDLEVRAGNPRRARTYYRRALALNPRDEGLQQLARRGPSR